MHKQQHDVRVSAQYHASDPAHPCDVLCNKDKQLMLLKLGSLTRVWVTTGPRLKTGLWPLLEKKEE